MSPIDLKNYRRYLQRFWAGVSTWTNGRGFNVHPVLSCCHAVMPGFESRETCIDSLNVCKRCPTGIREELEKWFSHPQRKEEHSQLLLAHRAYIRSWEHLVAAGRSMPQVASQHIKASLREIDACKRLLACLELSLCVHRSSMSAWLSIHSPSRKLSSRPRARKGVDHLAGETFHYERPYSRNVISHLVISHLLVCRPGNTFT